MKGLPEIEQMLDKIAKNRKTLQDLVVRVSNPNLEVDIKDSFSQVKELYGSLRFDFEDEETPINEYLLLSELKMFQTGIGHLIDQTKFKAMDSDFIRLKLKTNKGDEVKWYLQVRVTFNEYMRKINRAVSDQELSEIRTQV